ncbi:DUF6879 family protein [Streptacidiphilus sp. P02-A3a]|uniref:DUF6879 family protein n=1 Tax=Streptacidiphilus sp. P02-A3a TaxID=2704468 RepID=UPI0015F811E3|nr:DUF6879 family protein [Streptacidiphilus sp. P02-A3a]QMU70109.1 hypothetical protein GXP74_19620 [Streptacidiphilus sp. P02-A3a]QMU70438.1 hypothetical protein GXP74_21740 [Streptacidiphilus sp. P02-A3a]
MLLDGEEWQAKFREFTKEAWRLETLPQYLVPQEADEFSRFKNGEALVHAAEDAWTSQIRRHRAEGRITGRVHVVTRPLSDYLRFEFSRYYRHGADAGEEIRILDVTHRPNPLEGFQDFWFFDRSTVVLMNYEPDGRQINRVLHEGVIDPYLEAQRIAVAESVPFQEYVTG